MKKKVFISNYPFARYDQTALNKLKNEDFIIEINPLGRKLTADEVADLAKDYDALVAGTEDLSNLVENQNQLKIISRLGIGLDSVPLAKCREKGIMVTYTPDAVTNAVSELTLGLIMSSIRKISFADRMIRTGEWTRPFGYTLRDSILGIIGFGRAGKKLVHLISGISPQKILVNDIRDIQSDIELFQKKGFNIIEADKKDIYKFADIITLHVPLTPETRELISIRELKTFKKGSTLINTSRGGIVNEQDLFDGLLKGFPEFAAIDVFSKEPYQGPLCKLDNVLLTQHMGACTYYTRISMENEAVDSVIHFFQGKKVVNQVPEYEYDLQQK